MDIAQSLLSLSNSSRVYSDPIVSTEASKSDVKKEQYVRSIQHFKTWIIEKYSPCFDTVTDKFELDLLTMEMVIEFLMSKSQFPDGRCKSSSSINGYKRAIKSLYKAYGVQMTEQMSKIIDEYEPMDAKRKFNKFAQGVAMSTSEQRASKRQATERQTEVAEIIASMPLSPVIKAVPVVFNQKNQDSPPPPPPPPSPAPLTVPEVSYADFEAVMAQHKLRILQSLTVPSADIIITARSETVVENESTLATPINKTPPSASAVRLPPSKKKTTATATATAAVSSASSSSSLTSASSPQKPISTPQFPFMPSETSTPNPPVYHTWIWKSRVHSVPQNFVFPHTDVKTLWTLWQHGNPTAHIGPYRDLHGYDLDNNDGTDLSKARIVMTALERIASHSLKLVSSPEAISSLSRTQTDEIFDVTYKHMFEEYLSGNIASLNHVTEISYVTMYRHVKKHVNPALCKM